MSIVGRITSKGQTTVPSEVRAALGVGPGDHLEYVIDDAGRVSLRRAPSLLDLRGVLKSAVRGAGTDLATVVDMARDGRAGELLARRKR